MDPQEYLAALDQAASHFYDRIHEQIEEMQTHIDEYHIVALFTYTPSGDEFRIFDVGLRGPETLVFSGIDREGLPVQVITHYRSALLTTRVVPLRLDAPPETRRPIGFS